MTPQNRSNRPPMLPDKIAPILLGPRGPVSPVMCRVSPDLAHVAYWVSEGDARGIYVADPAGQSARVVWSTAEAHVSELAWSGDGTHLAFTISSGPPPGDVKIGVVELGSRRLTELSGLALAWAGKGATLLIADSLGRRLYFRDMELGVDSRIAELSDDGDPHFPPVLSVSPDQRRLAFVTRRVEENLTRVYVAQHDGRTWRAEEMTRVPGASLRILPFWSPDSAACALYVIDLEGHHTAMIGVPPGDDAEGEILYTSNSIDAVVMPAVHPDGRLIAFVRAHPRPGGAGGAEERLVLLDPVEHAVAPIAPPGAAITNLRWLDERTLLAEGSTVRQIRLRATEESAEAVERGETEQQPPPARDGFVRTLVEDVQPELSFACDVPADWQRVTLPSALADFADPSVMRPLAVFAPTYAMVVFTVAARPRLDGLSPAEALTMLAQAQGFEVSSVREVEMPFGPAAEADATGRSGADVLRLRLLMIEEGEHLFAITAMAAAPLWEAMKPALDRIVDSFELVAPRG